MTDANPDRPRPRGGLREKREAIVAGATTVFARDGYSRASIDAIAAEASVSTRTIYNHFADKADLFRTVIEESTRRVAEAQLAIMDRHLHRIVDLEGDLTEFARAWVVPMPDAADHFSLVAQVRAEGEHVPEEALDAWQEQGPRRVQRALASHFAQLAEEGRLRTDDADRAALHFARLVAPPERVKRDAPLSDAELAAFAASGVRAFLHGHLPRD